MFHEPWNFQGDSARAGQTDLPWVVRDREEAGSSRPWRWRRARTGARAVRTSPNLQGRAWRQRCRRVPNGDCSGRRGRDRCGQGPVGPRGRAHGRDLDGAALAGRPAAGAGATPGAAANPHRAGSQRRLRAARGGQPGRGRPAGGARQSAPDPRRRAGPRPAGQDRPAGRPGPGPLRRRGAAASCALSPAPWSRTCRS